MKWIILILLILPSVVFAYSPCEDYAPLSTRTQDGKETKLYIPGSKIFNAPQWSPKTRSNPPFSISQAYYNVLEWSSQNLARYDSIFIDSIEAKKYGCRKESSDKEYWYYIIEYNPIIDGDRLYGSGHWVAVLMSGEIIKPIRK